MKRFNKVVIIGVGMIGGSIGLALKKKEMAREVVGVFRRQTSLARALKKRAIDRGTLTLAEGVRGADLVVIATPVGIIRDFAERSARYLKKGAVMTDVGSVKWPIVRDLERSLPKDVSFIGAHPMAGSERSGVGSARADLFAGALCILTRTRYTDRPSLNIVRRFWQDIGARVTIVDPKLHDTRVAEISHLPHIVAEALCLTVDQGSIPYASGSFKDATRVASLNPDVWIDILRENRKNVIGAIERFIRTLSVLKADLSERQLRRFLRKVERVNALRGRYGL